MTGHSANNDVATLYLNARQTISLAKVHKGPAPTADQVAANYKKHGYTP